MTINISRPETESLINERLQSGEFKDAEDVIFRALQFLPGAIPAFPKEPAMAKDLVELFAPLRGLNMDFQADRNKDTGRDIEL